MLRKRNDYGIRSAVAGAAIGAPTQLASISTRASALLRAGSSRGSQYFVQLQKNPKVLELARLGKNAAFRLTSMSFGLALSAVDNFMLEDQSAEAAIVETAFEVSGAIVGAQVGAQFGMLLGPVGVAAGAVIGGVAGGLGGAWVGERASRRWS